MRTLINVNGGLGRVVGALPALQQYVLENPGTLVTSWGGDCIFDMTRIRTINVNGDNIAKKLRDVEIITPEPYHQVAYRKGEIDFAEAFAKDLGIELKSKDFGLNPDRAKVNHWRDHFDNLEEAKGKKLAMVQIKASGGRNIRDLNEETTKSALRALKDEGYFPVLIGELTMPFDVPNYFISNTSLADFVALIAIADIFVGGDSSGMHIARALDIPGIIYLTSTGGTKYYPDWFVEFRNPNYRDTFEFPRLFAGETQEMEKNFGNHLDSYVVTKAQFRGAIQEIECKGLQVTN